MTYAVHKDSSWAKSAVHRFRQGRSGIGWDTRAGVRRGNPDREVRYELHT